jgi:hypothetical protein
MIKSIKTGLMASVVVFGMSGLACQGMEIDRGNLFVPHGLAKHSTLTYDYSQQEFIATLDGQDRKIHGYDVSGVPSNLSREQMESFFNVGYFSLSQLGEDYSLKASIKLLGGTYGAKKAGASDGVADFVGGAAAAAVAGGLGVMAAPLAGAGAVGAGGVAVGAGVAVGIYAAGYAAHAAGAPPPQRRPAGAPQQRNAAQEEQARQMLRQHFAGGEAKQMLDDYNAQQLQQLQRGARRR